MLLAVISTIGASRKQIVESMVHAMDWSVSLKFVSYGEAKWRQEGYKGPWEKGYTVGRLHNSN
jgi:hypothetical protein